MGVRKRNDYFRTKRSVCIKVHCVLPGRGQEIIITDTFESFVCRFLFTELMEIHIHKGNVKTVCSPVINTYNKNYITKVTENYWKHVHLKVSTGSLCRVGTCNLRLGK